MKFKKGDKVICVGGVDEIQGCYPSTSIGKGWIKDKIFIIEKIRYFNDDGKFIGCCWEKGNIYGVYLEHLQLLNTNPNCKSIRV